MRINLPAVIVIFLVVISLSGCDGGIFTSDVKYETYAFEKKAKNPFKKIEIIVSYKGNEVTLREKVIHLEDNKVSVGQASSSNGECKYFDKKNWACRTSSGWTFKFYEMENGALYFGESIIKFGGADKNWRMEESQGGQDWKLADYQAKARKDAELRARLEEDARAKKAAEKAASEAKKIADEENAFKQHVAAQERERRENEILKNGGQQKGEVKSSAARTKQDYAVRYPFSARRAGLEGRVLLRALVDERGIATQVTVISSSGHRILDDAAVESVQTWDFYPATRNGLIEQSWVQIPVVFKLSNSPQDVIKGSDIQGLEAEYKRQIIAKIRSFIVLPPNVSDSARVEYEVVVLPGGEVLHAELKHSSDSNPAYERAVEMAILRAQGV